MTRYYQIETGSVYPEEATFAHEDGALVAVIDPEDRKAISLLASFILTSEGLMLSRVQEAVRAYAERSDEPELRPDEPTRPGAVVEAADGELWARRGDGIWTCLADARFGRPWSQVDAVKVLFAGEAA